MQQVAQSQQEHSVQRMLHDLVSCGNSPSLHLQGNAQNNPVWNSRDFPCTSKGSLSGNTKGVLQSQIPCVHLALEPTSSCLVLKDGWFGTSGKERGI